MSDTFVNIGDEYVHQMPAPNNPVLPVIIRLVNNGEVLSPQYIPPPLFPYPFWIVKPVSVGVVDSEPSGKDTTYPFPPPSIILPSEPETVIDLPLKLIFS
jgi:hypothetical protein